MLNYSDDELLTFARQGNDEAFAVIVNRYQQAVLATIRGMLGEVGAVQDIGQDVFIRFYKAIDNFKGDAKLRTYLTRIAINLSLNELQKRKRKSWLTFFRTNDALPEISDRSESWKRKEHQELIDKALLSLEKDLRAVIVLRLVDGFSTKEVAEMLDMPLGTVLSRLSRARTQLQEALIRLGYHH